MYATNNPYGVLKYSDDVRVCEEVDIVGGTEHGGKEADDVWGKYGWSVKKDKPRGRGKKGVWKGGGKRKGVREHGSEEDEWMPRIDVGTPRSWRRTGRRQMKHKNRRRREARRHRAARHRGVRRRLSIRGGADSGEDVR